MCNNVVYNIICARAVTAPPSQQTRHRCPEIGIRKYFFRISSHWRTERLRQTEKSEFFSRPLLRASLGSDEIVERRDVSEIGQTLYGVNLPTFSYGVTYWRLPCGRSGSNISIHKCARATLIFRAPSKFNRPRNDFFVTSISSTNQPQNNHLDPVWFLFRRKYAAVSETYTHGRISGRGKLPAPLTDISSEGQKYGFSTLSRPLPLHQPVRVSIIFGDSTRIRHFRTGADDGFIIRFLFLSKYLFAQSVT